MIVIMHVKLWYAVVPSLIIAGFFVWLLIKIAEFIEAEEKRLEQTGKK